jgi:hypothetical protein
MSYSSNNGGQILRLQVGSRMLPAKIIRFNKMNGDEEESDFETMHAEVSRAYVDPTTMIGVLTEGGQVQTPFSTFRLQVD